MFLNCYSIVYFSRLKSANSLRLILIKNSKCCIINNINKIYKNIINENKIKNKYIINKNWYF